MLWMRLVLLQQLRINLPPGLLARIIHLNDLDRHHLLLRVVASLEVVCVCTITCCCIELIVHSIHLDVSSSIHALPWRRLVVLQRLCEQVTWLIGQSVAIWAYITLVVWKALILSGSATSLCLRELWDLRHWAATVFSLGQRLSGFEEPWWVLLREEGWLPTWSNLSSSHRNIAGGPLRAVHELVLLARSWQPLVVGFCIVGWSIGLNLARDVLPREKLRAPIVLLFPTWTWKPDLIHRVWPTRNVKRESIARSPHCPVLIFFRLITWILQVLQVLQLGFQCILSVSAIAFGQTPLVSVVIGWNNHLGALTLSSDLRCHPQAIDALIGCLTLVLLLLE